MTLTDDLSSFLQIFYGNPVTFFTNFFQKAKANGLDEKALYALPFKTSIIFCVVNKMFFWLELSLKWMEFINIDDELNKALKTVVEDPKSPQSIRHKLIKVIRK